MDQLMNLFNYLLIFEAFSCDGAALGESMAQGVNGECLLKQELQVRLLLRLPGSLLGSPGIKEIDYILNHIPIDKPFPVDKPHSHPFLPSGQR